MGDLLSALGSIDLVGSGVFSGGPDIKKYQKPLASYGANPYASGLQSFLDNGGYKSDIAPLYDSMRARLNQQYTGQQQQGQDAIDRQFAAMGGGPGNGAQAKQTENLTAGIAQQKGQDLAQINEQQQQANIGADQFNAGIMGQVAGLNTGWDQANEQATNDAYNMEMNNFKAKHSGGLLGGGGMLGLGIGSGF